MSYGAYRTSEEKYKGKETIEYESKKAEGQVLRFVKKRSAMDREIWACIGCLEISKRMGAILPIPEITTRRGNFVTNPDDPAPMKHYPMCLNSATSPTSAQAALGRGARKRRSMADVERYEDTSAYDLLNAPSKKKSSKKRDESSPAPPSNIGPSISQLGLSQWKGGLCNFIMGPALDKDIEKGLVVIRSLRFPGLVWLFEKLKVKDKSFYRCHSCRNGTGEEEDGAFHDGYIKQMDRRIFGNPDAGHEKGCKPLDVNKVVALGLQREIVRELEEGEESGEGPSFNTSYGMAKLRVAGRCTALKGQASTVIFAMEDWKFEVEGLSVAELKAKVGAGPKREKSATPASTTSNASEDLKLSALVGNGNGNNSTPPPLASSNASPAVSDATNE